MAGPKIIPQRREQTAEPALDRMQAPANELASKLRACPFFVGKRKSVRFAASVGKVVHHRLGVPAACIVIRQNYDGTGVVARLAESVASAQVGLDLANQLNLVADVDCVLDLWFYPRASLPIGTSGESA